MKNLVFSMLAMAAMVSCTSESDPIDEVDNGQPVEIKMSAGLVQTKAAIESNGSNQPTSDLNIFFIRAEDGATANWANLSSSITAKITKEQNNITDINPVQYYNTDAALSTYLIGYYPLATIAADQLEWTINGTQDIIIAPVQSATKIKKDALAFAFAHKLTQLQFKVGAAKGFSGAGNLEHIKIKGAKTKAVFTPSTELFAFSPDETGDLSTESPTTTAIPQFTGNTPENPISGGNIMVEAGTADTNFTIELKTSTGTYTGEITVAALAGKAYEVTLTVNQQSITGSATLAKWEVITGGAGEVI